MTRRARKPVFVCGDKAYLFKGADVAQLYPSEDMREMADIDVYADLDSHEKIKEVLTQAGYSFEGHKGHHDKFSTATRSSRSRFTNPCSTISARPGLIHTLCRRGSSPTETDLNIISTRATIIFFLWVICSVISIRRSRRQILCRYGALYEKYKDELDWVKISSVFERYNLDEVMNNLKGGALTPLVRR